MTRLRWWCIGLLLTAIAGCDLPQVVLVCERDGVETYRSEPEPDWVLRNGGWYAPSSSQEYRQSMYESCATYRVGGP